MMMKKLNWGILGTGNIAGQFAEGLRGSERGMLTAVGSRNIETAQAFAVKYQALRAFATYDGVLADPEVEAVYVSLPNSMHHEWTIKALQAGKHVLCEKPLATNLTQAREMFDMAERTGRVLVEAFMYRSHPVTQAVEAAVAGGRIGKLRLIRTSFVYYAKKMEGNVRFDAELAGGALMDIGCYCLSLSRLLAKAEPLSMRAVGHLHESGVDDYAAGVLAFPGDIVSTFACGMTVHADNTAHISGTGGHIEIPLPWRPAIGDAHFVLATPTGREVVNLSTNKHLFALEADDFAGTILDGRMARVSRADSLGNQACLDELRRQVGVRF